MTKKNKNNKNIIKQIKIIKKIGFLIISILILIQFLHIFIFDLFSTIIIKLI